MVINLKYFLHSVIREITQMIDEWCIFLLWDTHHSVSLITARVLTIYLSVYSYEV